MSGSIGDTPGDNAIDTLVGETRMVRLKVHDLVVRMQDERRFWEQRLATLSAGTRLTPAQRRQMLRLRETSRARRARVLHS
jgi:hypothetical protein